MLNTLYEWCKKWRMKANINKSKIIHFRTKGHKQTEYRFKLGNEFLDIDEKYKYLGIVMDEFLDFNTTASVLAESGGRALGAVYSKFKYNKGFGYETYTKMFNTGIVPILDYCSGVWGFSKFNKVDTIQNRAIRLYLSVHKFAPNAAINGDMGWVYNSVRRKGEMIRLWNRFICMNNERLTKNLFLEDKRICKNNWCSDLCKTVQEIGAQRLLIMKKLLMF